jgi:hypothetical protein
MRTRQNFNFLAKKLKSELEADILNRYSNAEYWDISIAKALYQDYRLTETEIQRIIEIAEL